MSINQHDKNYKLFRKFINETSIYDYDPETGEKTASKGVTDSGTVEVGHGNELVGKVGEPTDFMDTLLNGFLGGLIAWLVARKIISKIQARAARRQLKADFEKYKKKGLSDKKAYKKALENFKNNNPNVKELLRASKDLEKYKKTRKGRSGRSSRYNVKYDNAKVRARLKRIPGAGRTGRVFKWLGVATATECLSVTD